MIASHDLTPFVPAALGYTDLPFLDKQSGKERDWYPLADQKHLIVTTDRLSAFDIVHGRVLNKGQVLNQLTNWWMHRTDDLIATQILAEPDPSAVIAYPPPCDAFGRVDDFSSLTMTSGNSPIVVLEPVNAALHAAKPLGLVNSSVREAVALYQRKEVDKIMDDDAALHRPG